MREINQYADKYSHGIFIEPIPSTFELLHKNLKLCNENFKTNFSCIESLITNYDDKVYDFHLYGQLKKPNGNNVWNI